MAKIVNAGDSGLTDSLSSCLVNRGIAIAPCDTIYGILGITPDTGNRIRDIKGRGEQKPFITLHASLNAIIDLSIDEIPAAVLDLLPGPLTLIVKTSAGKEGVRVPADDFLLNVLDRTGPLYSTSVNLSGSPSLWRIRDIIRTFEGKVDMIFDGGDLENKTPSTILDITDKPFTLVRQGALTLSDEVLRMCEK